MQKIFLIAVFFSSQHFIKAQQRIFYENFENRKMGPAWQKVSGNWHIASVQELKIAPAETENVFVLSSGGSGFIRLLADIPGTMKTRMVKLSFSYYINSGNSTATVEVEFHKKDLKDGSKGKLWKAVLPRKGRWSIFQKTLSIPAGANLIWLSFSETAKENDSNKGSFFDNVMITSVR